MKKFVSLWVVLVMIFGILVTGCGNQDKQTDIAKDYGNNNENAELFENIENEGAEEDVTEIIEFPDSIHSSNLNQLGDLAYAYRHGGTWAFASRDFSMVEYVSDACIVNVSEDSMTITTKKLLDYGEGYYNTEDIRSSEYVVFEDETVGFGFTGGYAYFLIANYNKDNGCVYLEANTEVLNLVPCSVIDWLSIVIKHEGSDTYVTFELLDAYAAYEQFY